MRRIGAGRPSTPSDPWGTGGDNMHEGWRDELSDRLSGLADAWAGPEAFEGEAMGGTMPRQMIGSMAFAEVVLHGWDLARGTGQQLVYDDEARRRALEVMGQIGEMGDPRARSGRGSTCPRTTPARPGARPGRPRPAVDSLSRCPSSGSAAGPAPHGRLIR